MFTSLMKAAVGVVTLPIDLVADVVTLPASAYYDREFRTVRKGREILRNLDDATKPGER